MTDHSHDRDTVVVEDRGSGAGVILGVLLIAALLIGVWWFALGPGAGEQAGPDVNVNVPEDVNVDVNQPPAS